ncbi:hypothetical protein MTO96_032085 [Rhipicephalus appendiculatus]
MAAAIVPAAPEDHGGFCRFCAGDSSNEPLVTPCNCEGTISTSHKSCLEKRILQNGCAAQEGTISHQAPRFTTL